MRALATSLLMLGLGLGSPGCFGGGPSKRDDGPKPTQGTVRGEVRWNGEGVPDNEVMLCEEIERFFGGCSGLQYTTRTDAEGKYVFENVTPRDYVVAVRVFETDEYLFMSSFLEPQKITVRAGEELSVSTRTLAKKDLVTSSPKEGELVTGDEITLSWEPYPKATRYTVVVREKGDHDELRKLQIHEPSVVVANPRPDCDGCSYTWEVSAFNEGGAKISETDFARTFSVAKQPSEAADDP